ELRRKQERTPVLARERNAVILAHSYQRDEIQEVAHLVGDSLKLSQEAAQTRSDVIVFCGVNFMAETAAILCPERTVLLPDTNAGCSLSAAITAGELREWKARYPDAVVVSYVNTSAAVKAESDYCCTSANAVKVVAAIPADRRVLFVPDRFLGAYVARMPKRMNMLIYARGCVVHLTVRPEQADGAFMTTITLDNVIRSRETLKPQIRIPEDIATKARRAIDRMLELA